MKQKVLDPCCGSRMMWFDRQHPNVMFCDIRKEVREIADQSHGKEGGKRTLIIDPDIVSDFRALPFADGAFRLVVFDPPHLTRVGTQSWLCGKYGKLGSDWRATLRLGFTECFRVLDSDGILVFKWNEIQVPLREILALSPFRPLFGHHSGRRSLTHWLLFMKN